MMKRLFFITGALGLLVACGDTQGYRTSPGNENPESNETSAAMKSQPNDLIKLVKREVVDREGTNLVASTYLLPSDWTVQDRLYWEYQDATLPVRFQAKMQNGDGSMGIQVFPDIRAVWSSGPAGVSGYRPPADILSGMKELIVAERRDKNIRYVREKVLTNKQQNTGQGMQWAQAAVVQIEYEENGRTIEEEFYANLDIADMVTPSLMGNMESIIWAASGLYACKAEKGKLELCRKIAQTVSASARLTKPFYNRLSQVIQLLSDQVYARIYQAGQISRIISQTNDQMLANIDASYRESQQAYDRINQQFSDYVRGVDRYQDSGNEIQLPSGYEHAWVNDRGEYLLTNTTGYEPGRDFNGQWRMLERN